MTVAATKDTHKTTPIVTAKRLTIAEIAPDLALPFTEEEYAKLQKGLIPTAMEDKWFIYCENDCLHFHRSWTGEEWYRAQIIEEDDGEEMKYAIKEFYAERDASLNPKPDDEQDLRILAQLLLWGILGIDIRSSFIEKYGEGTKGALYLWSLFGRMFFPENGLIPRAKC